jgi:hypothetical protein
MICPHCKREIADEEALELITEEAVLRKSGSIRGARGRGEAKARDPEKMRAAGKLGGRPKKKKPKQVRKKISKKIRKRFAHPPKRAGG